MRLVFVHADSFRVESEDAPRDSTGGRQGPCLVVFCTLERRDRGHRDAVVANATGEIAAVATHLGVDRIVCYPSPHLSPTPAETGGFGAVERLSESVSERLDGCAVEFVPADAKTAFDLAAKGHPHARQSVRVGPFTGQTDCQTARNWSVRFTDGTTQPAADVSAAASNAAALDPTTKALLERLGANDWQALGLSTALPQTVDASEETAGLWARDGVATPRDQFLRNTIAEHVHTQATEFGASAIGTPVGHGYQRGHGSQPLSGLPLGMPRTVASSLAAAYGPEDASRCCQMVTSKHHGDQTGADGQPPWSQTSHNLWALTADTEHAGREIRRQATLVDELADALRLELTPVLRLSEGEATHREELADDIGSWVGRPMLVETGTQTAGPWDLELAFVTQVSETPVQLGSVGVALDGLAGFQAERHNGSPAVAEETGSVVCAALCSSLERTVDTIIAHARGRDPPRLPAWLAPAQVRLVPTDPEAYTDVCQTLADDIEHDGVRVTIDDRPLSVGERLDAAAESLVPYVAVVGRPEADGDALRVTDRAARSELDLPPAALRDRLDQELTGWPRKRRPVPRLVSKQFWSRSG